MYISLIHSAIVTWDLPSKTTIQKSRSVLQDGSRFLYNWFGMEKKSYKRRNTVDNSKFNRICRMNFTWVSYFIHISV